MEQMFLHKIITPVLDFNIESDLHGRDMFVRWGCVVTFSLEDYYGYEKFREHIPGGKVRFTYGATDQSRQEALKRSMQQFLDKIPSTIEAPVSVEDRRYSVTQFNTRVTFNDDHLPEEFKTLMKQLFPEDILLGIKLLTN